MVRLTKIYTRTGDGGKTRLAGGQQVPKDSLRIDAYGTVDELNAILGMVRAAIAGHAAIAPQARDDLVGWIAGLQHTLFNTGSDLATYIEDQRDGQPVVQASDIEALETWIDEHNADLGVLESFVLPGGGPVSALLHQARTVCRRAERRVLALAREEPVREHVIPFLNRLSDAFFVASRWVGRACGEAEILWEY